MTPGPGPQGVPQEKQIDKEPSLIDWGDPKPDVVGGSATQVTSKMSGLNMKGATASVGAIPKTPIVTATKKVEEDADFDMFAQSRTTSYEKSKSRY